MTIYCSNCYRFTEHTPSDRKAATEAVTCSICELRTIRTLSAAEFVIEAGEVVGH